MEDLRERKREILEDTHRKLQGLSPDEVAEKNRAVENRLFEFANFLESRIVLLYTHRQAEVATTEIIRRSFDYNKIVVLPVFDPLGGRASLVKVDNYQTDMKKDSLGRLEPDPERCKQVPIDCIDIAIIPGKAFDEKGGRIGRGDAFYERLLPSLPVTTRKVALAFESQVVPQLPLETNDRPVDIIITEKRTIYKI